MKPFSTSEMSGALNRINPGLQYNLGLISGIQTVIYICSVIRSTEVGQSNRELIKIQLSNTVEVVVHFYIVFGS